jgi:hypothetical protein
VVVADSMKDIEANGNGTTVCGGREEDASITTSCRLACIDGRARNWVNYRDHSHLNCLSSPVSDQRRNHLSYNYMSILQSLWLRSAFSLRFFTFGVEDYGADTGAKDSANGAKDSTNGAKAEPVRSAVRSSRSPIER